jgi:hypothetical protein
VFLGRAIMAVKLSTLSICLGLSFAALNLIGLLFPARFGAGARKFPRSIPTGCVLTLLGTAWFVWIVRQESLADFEPLKPLLFTLFVGVGLGTCFFVQDFLAVRGCSVLLLLLGKLMVDAERWAASEWRLVIAVWAYMMVLGGMWFTISPWRMRDLIYWGTANETRIRITSGFRFAFGVFVAALGFTVF